MPPAAQQTRSLFRPAVWRGLAFAFAYLAGFVGLMSGVEVSERDLTGAGIAERAYYALGLFVLGGLDIGTPLGGPPVGRFLLWLAYFAAPVITASALIEAALRIIRPLANRVRRLDNHVVLGGAGRLTRLYVRKLREQDRERTIVVVEQDPNHPSLRELRDRHRATIINGDVTSDSVLRALRLDRAHRVLLLTGDDFVNLDAASKIARLEPRLVGRLVVHVSNLGLMRETSESSISQSAEIFNGHEAAAVNLVQEHLLERFHSTPDRDLVVLGGFGRFGQTVLHQLQQHAMGSFGHVVIIDEMAEPKVRSFSGQPGFADDYRRSVLDGDLLDPQVWEQVGALVDEHGEPPVIVIGSGTDSTNLHAALLVRRRHGESHVIVRSFRASPFTVEIAEEIGAHAFDLAGLIEAGMPARWFN